MVSKLRIIWKRTRSTGMQAAVVASSYLSQGGAHLVPNVTHIRLCTFERPDRPNREEVGGRGAGTVQHLGLVFVQERSNP